MQRVVKATLLSYFPGLTRRVSSHNSAHPIKGDSSARSRILSTAPGGVAAFELLKRS